MYIYLLFAVSVLLGFLNQTLGKYFQLGFKMDFRHFILYNLINASLATVYFFAGNKFLLHMNLTTLLFSVVYALLVMVSLIISIVALSKVSISLSQVSSTAGSVVLSAMFGIIVLKEAVSINLILSVMFMLLSVAIPYFSFRGSNKKGGGIISAVLFINAGLSIIIQKIYTKTPGVCEANSFFLMTNIIIVLICAVILMYLRLKNGRNNVSLGQMFTKKQLGIIASRTLLSNVSSVISIIIIANMNISVYTVMASSLTLVAAAANSKFVFKERLHLSEWISMGCAVCAIFLNTL